MKDFIQLFAVASLAFSSGLLAHVKVSSSEPANQAMLMQTPKKLSLSFSQEVRVIKATLKTKQGKKVDFDFKPTKQAAAEFSWALPKLAPANYQVDLIFLGSDGHKMKERFDFMLH